MISNTSLPRSRVGTTAGVENPEAAGARSPAEGGEGRMRGGALVPRVCRLTTLATGRAWALPPHAVVGLACVVLAAAACTGTRDLATRGPASDSNIRSLIGTGRLADRDGPSRE